MCNHTRQGVINFNKNRVTAVKKYKRNLLMCEEKDKSFMVDELLT